MHVWHLSFFRERCHWWRFLPLDLCDCSEETVMNYLWPVMSNMVFIGSINYANRKPFSLVCIAALSNVYAKSPHWCPTLNDPKDCSPPGLLCPWDSPGKNTGVGCHHLLQGSFLIQGWNPHLFSLLHCQTGSLPLMLPGKLCSK